MKSRAKCTSLPKHCIDKVGMHIFKTTLFTQKVSKQKFSALRSLNQKILQISCERKCFSPLHYSRYLLGDNEIEDIPFGYKRMNPQEIESVENEANLFEQCLV